MTGYMLDGSGFDSRQGKILFLCSTASRPSLGPNQSPIYWAARALWLGVKRQGHYADRKPPSYAETYGVIPPL
jgi:hypothetical protein